MDRTCWNCPTLRHMREGTMRQGRPSFKPPCSVLSENPIVPTPEQLRELIRERSPSPGTTEDLFLRCIDWWQRRMFLAPEPEIPKDVRGHIDSRTADA